MMKFIKGFRILCGVTTRHGQILQKEQGDRSTIHIRRTNERGHGYRRITIRSKNDIYEVNNFGQSQFMWNPKAWQLEGMLVTSATQHLHSGHPFRLCENL